MAPQKIQVKGLSPDQVDRLLPEGLISLCWRGSVARAFDLAGGTGFGAGGIVVRGDDLGVSHVVFKRLIW